MGKFGWDLPPGCSVRDLPGNQPVGPCECCGRDPEGDPNDGGCVCPECPKCGSVGDTVCYPAHGLRYSVRQVIGRDNANELQRLAVIAEARFWDQYKEETHEWAY